MLLRDARTDRRVEILTYFYFVPASLFYSAACFHAAKLYSRSLRLSLSLPDFAFAFRDPQSGGFSGIWTTVSVSDLPSNFVFCGFSEIGFRGAVASRVPRSHHKFFGESVSRVIPVVVLGVPKVGSWAVRRSCQCVPQTWCRRSTSRRGARVAGEPSQAAYADRLGCIGKEQGNRLASRASSGTENGKNIAESP